MRVTMLLTILFAAGASSRLAAQAQPPGATSAQSASQSRSYAASGKLTDAARERLKTALGKVAGVERIEIREGAASFTVRVFGAARANPVSMAAISAGFDFRPAPSRTFSVAGPSAEADMARLKEALSRLDGVEQADTMGTGAGQTVSVQGEAKVSAIVSAAKSAGFELRRSLTFVASGSATDKDLARLREAIGKVDGVQQSEVKAVGGGGAVSVQGRMEDEDLTGAAKSAGYSLKPLSSTAGITMFSVLGVNTPEDEEKLRKAVQAVIGIGEFQIMTLGDNTRLGVRGGSAAPEAIVAAATVAGYTLIPGANRRQQSDGPDTEKNTPPAYDERVNEDLTNVGDMAPDFELTAKKGSGKIRLSDYRGKKPVVLIFGSYT